MTDIPRGSTATYAVLYTGYGSPGVAATVGFIQDGDRLIVTDPGMVRHRSVILEPLAELGFQPEDITDVIFSHHHPDHTLNAALFERARFHDHMAIYQGDQWDSRDADGYELTPSVKLIRTPGHSFEDISTLVGTGEKVVAFTHLWNTATSVGDAHAADLDLLHAGRERLISIADVIVPGHGPAFTPTKDTPR